MNVTWEHMNDILLNNKAESSRLEVAILMAQLGEPNVNVLSILMYIMNYISELFTKERAESPGYV